MTPGWWLVPSMVCVLPAPVAPYAKQHPLYPSNTPSTSVFVVFWNTWSVRIDQCRIVRPTLKILQ
jgi:hypothetical protein